jgi:hypothetical protein
MGRKITLLWAAATDISDHCGGLLLRKDIRLRRGINTGVPDHCSAGRHQYISAKDGAVESRIVTAWPQILQEVRPVRLRLN